MGLEGVRVAAIMTDGVEESEFMQPAKALREAGATVDVITPEGKSVQAMRHRERGDIIQATADLEGADPGEYDALLVPGGVANPDALRMNDRAVTFVKELIGRGAPAGVICHGPWMLVEADVVRGRTVTSWPSLRTDIRNAGGEWVDREVVVDKGLVTSRKPDDLPAFCRSIIEEFGEGRHAAAAGGRGSGGSAQGG
jgi:protease I